MSKNNAVKWVVIGCGGAIVMFIVFIGVIFFVVGKATEGPELIITDFLMQAGDGNYQVAYDHFSVPLKESQDFEAFKKMATEHPSLFKVVDTTFSNRSADLNGAQLSGTLTLEAGTKVPASFSLVKENDTWKLISYNISP